MPDRIEIWKNVVGFELSYQISNNGRVKSYPKTWSTKIAVITQKEKILKPRKRRNGYYSVQLTLNKKAKDYDIHRLVSIAFIDNHKNKPQVNHKNGVKTDNRVENLEWCTRRENSLHSYDIGLHKYNGENCNLSKLKITEVLEIIELTKMGVVQKEIGKIYGVGQQQISKICRGESWRHIYSNENTEVCLT